MWGNNERPDDDERERALDAIRLEGLTETTLEIVLKVPGLLARAFRAAMKNQEDN